MNSTTEAEHDAIAESPPARALSPWHYEPTLTPTRLASSPGAFIRVVALDPARLASLPAWWRQHARDERAEVASRLFLGEPRAEAHGSWCIGGALRSPGRRHSIPIDLRLWPRLGAWTMLALEPQQDVHLGRRYFSSGQRVLDVLCGRLIRELDAVC